MTGSGLRTSLLILPAAALVACGGGGGVVLPEANAAPARPANWRAVATAADRTRLRNWRATWFAALAEARAADASAVAREGVLFQPDRTLDRPIPPSGTYRCRTFKLGARGAGGRGFTEYPWFECRVDDEGAVTSMYKSNGSQRPVGVVFADGTTRGVFLGTLVLGDESGALEYGRDATRDMAGIVERIGERRWRIAFPEPRFESRLDVIELVPAR